MSRCTVELVWVGNRQDMIRQSEFCSPAIPDATSTSRNGSGVNDDISDQSCQYVPEDEKTVWFLRYCMSELD